MIPVRIKTIAAHTLIAAINIHIKLLFCRELMYFRYLSLVAKVLLICKIYHRQYNKKPPFPREERRFQLLMTNLRITRRLKETR